MSDTKWVDVTTRGDTICPICGDAYFRCDHYPNSLISEISRLKAALEKESNRVVELLRENCDLKTDRDDAISALKQARNEMDEYKDSLNREFEGARELRESCGARDVETFPAFVERLYSERDVARLALEKAERERDSNKFLLGVYKGGFASGRSERDEARRWAKYYQKLAQKWKDKYEDTKKGDSRGYEVAEALK